MSGSEAEVHISLLMAGIMSVVIPVIILVYVYE